MKGKVLWLVLVLCAVAGIDGCGRKSTQARAPTEATIVAATAPPNNERTGGSSRSSGSTRSGSRSRSGGSSRSSLTDSDLQQLSEELLRLDPGLTQPSVSRQGKTSSRSSEDMARNPLIANVPRRTMKNRTVALMQELLDNYIPQSSIGEDRSLVEQSEEDSFLNAVMQTPLMQKLERFLQEKELIRGGLRSTLKDIWFTLYKRGGRQPGSSGFEHVFVGEVKGGKVSGFHNWLSFRKEEVEGDLDYQGYIKAIDLQGKGQIIKLRFKWLQELKPVGTLFVGTTPELEMALYTLCFLAKPDAHCKVQLAGKQFRIRTWTLNFEGKTVIGSAYPDI